MSLRRTVYHEARHAEQLYNQARMLAGKGRSAKEITTLVGTTNKPEVAEEATSRPLARGSTEFVVAEQMFEAGHGEAGKRHDALEKEVVAKRKARDDALAAAGGNRTDPRVVKAQAEYDKVHAQYADLADEADAFATSDDAAKTPRDSNLEAVITRHRNRHRSISHTVRPSSSARYSSPTASAQDDGARPAGVVDAAYGGMGGAVPVRNAMTVQKYSAGVSR